MLGQIKIRSVIKNLGKVSLKNNSLGNQETVLIIQEIISLKSTEKVLVDNLVVKAMVPQMGKEHEVVYLIINKNKEENVFHTDMGNRVT